jgi:hypothetical protein
MRSRNEELYEEWCERARLFEYQDAKQRLTKKEDIETILEEMSIKLLAKMLHPLFDFARNEIDIRYDPVKSQTEYKRLYLDKVSPVPDHVVDDGHRDKYFS